MKLPKDWAFSASAVSHQKSRAIRLLREKISHGAVLTLLLLFPLTIRCLKNIFVSEIKLMARWCLIYKSGFYMPGAITRNTLHDDIHPYTRGCQSCCHGKGEDLTPEEQRELAFLGAKISRTCRLERPFIQTPSYVSCDYTDSMGQSNQYLTTPCKNFMKNILLWATCKAGAPRAFPQDRVVPVCGGDHYRIRHWRLPLECQ